MLSTTFPYIGNGSDKMIIYASSLPDKSGFWAFTDIKGNILCKMTEDIRLKLWDALIDPATETYWNCCYQRYADTHARVSVPDDPTGFRYWYPPTPVTADQDRSLRECISYAILHHGIVEYTVDTHTVYLSKKANDHPLLDYALFADDTHGGIYCSIATSMDQATRW